jgi:protein-tyrosine phosphatase
MPYIVAGGGLHGGIGHAGGMVREISAAGSLPQPRNPQLPYRICLVCLGNICRSPMGEVLLRDELHRSGLDGRVEVESAGTGDWHLGEAMDRRAMAELSRHGYDGSMHEARQIQAPWLHDYDLLLAMDRANLSSLRRMAGRDDDVLGRIQLMLSFDPDAPAGAEVPDPYNGGPEDYAEAFELVQAAARGLASQLAAKL